MHRQEHSSLRQGLVGAWVPSLGASGLSLIDRSGRNNHGTLTNMGGQDNWPASGSGVALSFDGTNDRVSTSLVTKTSGQFSYSIWVFPRLLNAYQAVFSTQNNNAALELFVDLSGSRFAALGFNANFSSTFINATINQWQHLAVSIDGSAFSLYRNGILGSSGTFTPFLQPTAGLSVGARSNGANSFNGLIDDFRFYARTLSASEIRLLASRRGIGLTPLPDRAAGLPRKLSVNVGGDWRAADAYVNVGGVWKLGQASVNVAGTWR